MSRRSLMPICLLSLLAFTGAPAAHSAGNCLLNPGFENNLEGWNAGPGQSSPEAHLGKGSAVLSQTAPSWAGIEQSVLLPPQTAKIRLSGWVRTSHVVPGKESWEQARLNVEFHDAAGALAGGYQASTGTLSGDQGWTEMTHDYDVPAGSAKVNVQCQLGNCAGTAWYDDLDLRLFDAKGVELAKAKLSGPSDEGTWYKLEPAKPGDPGTWADWSGLEDAPAGKHGFVRANAEGHLEFADGVPARFWGASLVAGNVFCSHGQADQLAERLSRMGVNLLRLHHMDAPWAETNIFGKKATTRQLDPVSMEKLDYLIATLKKKGIYLFLDLLVHRDFLAADGIADKPPELGGKQVAYFAPKLIDLQKEYAVQLLTHLNPYTHLAYKDEPAIAGSEFINESTPSMHFGADLLGDGPYRKMLEDLWAKSAYKHKVLGRFAQDWDHHGRLKVDGPGDGDAMLKFFYALQTQYLVEMTRALRQAGCRYLLAGSNFPEFILEDQAANSRMDLVIFNGYWDHPQIWKIQNNWNRILEAPIDNASLLSAGNGNLVDHFAKAKVKGKPFLVTEWNDCFPNEYRLEGPPLLAAYAALQGWDGMLQFDFDHETAGAAPLSAFDLSRWPDELAQWVVAAPLFHRRDVKEAPGQVEVDSSEAQVLSMPSDPDYLNAQPWIPFVTRFTKGLMTPRSGVVGDVDAFHKYVDASTGVMRSETGELTLDPKGRFFEVATDRVQGAEGAWKGRKADFGAFSAELQNGWGSVFLVSRQSVPLDETPSAYLVVTTPVKMTGETFAEDRGHLTQAGAPPILAQQAEGTVVLKRKTAISRVTVRPLSMGGVPGKPLSLKTVPGGISIPISSGRSFVYEVTFK